MEMGMGGLAVQQFQQVVQPFGNGQAVSGVQMVAMAGLGMSMGVGGVGESVSDDEGQEEQGQEEQSTDSEITMVLESLAWCHNTDAPCYRTFGSGIDAESANDPVRRFIGEMLCVRLPLLTTLELTLAPDYHIPGRHTGPPATLDHLWKGGMEDRCEI